MKLILVIIIIQFAVCCCDRVDDQRSHWQSGSSHSFYDKWFVATKERCRESHGGGICITLVSNKTSVSHAKQLCSDDEAELVRPPVSNAQLANIRKLLHDQFGNITDSDYFWISTGFIASDGDLFHKTHNPLHNCMNVQFKTKQCDSPEYAVCERRIIECPPPFAALQYFCIKTVSLDKVNVSHAESRCHSIGGFVLMKMMFETSAPLKDYIVSRTFPNVQKVYSFFADDSPGLKKGIYDDFRVPTESNKRKFNLNLKSAENFVNRRTDKKIDTHSSTAANYICQSPAALDEFSISHQVNNPKLMISASSFLNEHVRVACSATRMVQRMDNYASQTLVHYNAIYNTKFSNGTAQCPDILVPTEAYPTEYTVGPLKPENISRHHLNIHTDSSQLWNVCSPKCAGDQMCVLRQGSSKCSTRDVSICLKVSPSISRNELENLDCLRLITKIQNYTGNSEAANMSIMGTSFTQRNGTRIHVRFRSLCEYILLNLAGLIKKACNLKEAPMPLYEAASHSELMITSASRTVHGVERNVGHMFPSPQAPSDQMIITIYNSTENKFYEVRCERSTFMPDYKCSSTPNIPLEIQRNDKSTLVTIDKVMMFSIVESSYYNQMFAQIFDPLLPVQTFTNSPLLEALQDLENVLMTYMAKHEKDAYSTGLSLGTDAFNATISIMGHLQSLMTSLVKLTPRVKRALDTTSLRSLFTGFGVGLQEILGTIVSNDFMELVIGVINGAFLNPMLTPALSSLNMAVVQSGLTPAQAAIESIKLDLQSNQGSKLRKIFRGLKNGIDEISSARSITSQAANSTVVTHTAIITTPTYGFSRMSSAKSMKDEGTDSSSNVNPSILSMGAIIVILILTIAVLVVWIWLLRAGGQRPDQINETQTGTTVADLGDGESMSGETASMTVESKVMSDVRAPNLTKATGGLAALIECDKETEVSDERDGRASEAQLTGPKAKDVATACSKQQYTRVTSFPTVTSQSA